MCFPCHGDFFQLSASPFIVENLPGDRLQAILIDHAPSLSLYFDQAKLTLQAMRLLEEFARECGNNPFLRLEIFGYTDTMGAEDYNWLLSWRRADVVATSLHEQGVRAPVNVEGRGVSRVDQESPVLMNVRDRRVDIYKKEY